MLKKFLSIFRDKNQNISSEDYVVYGKSKLPHVKEKYGSKEILSQAHILGHFDEREDNLENKIHNFLVKHLKLENETKTGNKYLERLINDEPISVSVIGGLCDSIQELYNGNLRSDINYPYQKVYDQIKKIYHNHKNLLNFNFDDFNSTIINSFIHYHKDNICKDSRNQVYNEYLLYECKYGDIDLIKRFGNFKKAYEESRKSILDIFSEENKLDAKSLGLFNGVHDKVWDTSKESFDEFETKNSFKMVSIKIIYDMNVDTYNLDDLNKKYQDSEEYKSSYNYGYSIDI